MRLVANEDLSLCLYAVRRGESRVCGSRLRMSRNDSSIFADWLEGEVFTT